MRIYELVTIDIDGNTIEEISYNYCGRVSECKGGESSSTTYTEPPAWLNQYMPKVAEKGWKLEQQNPMTYYSGDTVAGFTPEQTQAMNLTKERATAGSPLLKTAQTEAQKTLSGQYLSPESNPWLRATYNQGTRALGEQFGEQTMPMLRSSAMGEGAYGGSRHGIAEGMAYRGLAQSEKDLANQIYGGAYNTERGIMGQTLPQAQGLAEANYNDISRLAAVGEEKQAMSQALIDEQIKRHEYKQLEPWERLGMFTNILSGDFGGTTIADTTTSGK
jgi:hypothetical protein